MTRLLLAGSSVRRPLLLVLLLLVCLAPGVLAADAQTTFFPVERVRPGLKGYGLTVVEGTKIDRFDVEVLGLVRAAGPAGDLILVRVSGPVVEPFGGIAAGMSGSPVYIDDQLLGAIGFAFEFSDHSVGLVTPIGEMLQVLDRVGVRDAVAAAGTPAGEVPGGESAGRTPAPYRALVLAPDPDAAARMSGRYPDGIAVMVPVETPVMIHGLGLRTQRVLEKWLKPYRLLFLPGGSGTAQASGAGAEAARPGAPVLAPGSAFGVALVRGDVELTAIGTVTYVEGERFVGFGHPFLQKGHVDFFAGPAFIHRTVGSLSTPFKLGTMLASTGVLSEDRRAAVAGQVGAGPKAIDLVVHVQEAGSPSGRTLNAQIVRDDLLSVPLASVAALEALDRGLDRIGPGTARVIYRIQGSALPGGGVFAGENMYYSRLDVSARLLTDFLDTLQTLLFNRFQDVGVDRVELSVQVSQDQKTAVIVRARPLSSRVRPGERVGVEVEVLPHRGEPQVRVLTLEIPQTASPGPVTITVRGGASEASGLSPEIESLLTGQEPPASGEASLPDEEAGGEVPTSLEKLLELLDRRERNNQIVAEFYPAYAPAAETGPAAPSSEEAPVESMTRSPSTPAKGKEKGDKSQERQAAAGAVKATLITPWVIQGSADFDLEIAEPEEPETSSRSAPAPISWLLPAR